MTQTVHQRLLAIAADAGVSLDYPAEVLAEVSAIDRAAAVADPSLEDWTALPMVTIDGPSSRDLDQALHVEARPGGGHRVHYALADAAHFVPRGSSLYAESERRGASIYFPTFAAPMLPRALSEDVVSLNPDGPRRALAFRVEISAQGEAIECSVHRVRIRSRAKLSFPQVQAYYDAPAASALRGEEFEASLQQLAQVGTALIDEARRRDVAHYRRSETDYEVRRDALGEYLAVVDAPRLMVERYNEQLSLLVNREGARILMQAGEPRVEPIYRVHPAPREERLADLVRTLHGIADVHGLDAHWRFDPSRQSLGEYLDALPSEGLLGRIAFAIHRQAIVINSRSSFSAERGLHHGVGAEAYARYSAPMRELVGVYVHHEMLDLLAHAPVDDSALRPAVVLASNAAKDAQRKVNEQVLRLVLDDLFTRDVRHPPAERPRRQGTLMGITSSKLHVALDEPRLDVKLYLRDVGRARGRVWLVPSDNGAELRERESGARVARVGDPVTIWLEGKDERQDRWVLQLG